VISEAAAGGGALKTCKGTFPQPGRWISQTDGSKSPRTLVRRVYARPVPLQTRPVVGPRGCHLQGMGEAPATRVSGPYIVSGGWWARPVHREYHFAETETGRILWIYFDKTRRSWFLHGEVE
jgi:protein ImuB